LLASDGNEAGTITRQVTQSELATMVGGARQTVNQELRSLESSGYIRPVGRAFALLDREQLQRLASR
jgi:CRP-like cAMP-binding protein